ncbi:MAG: hypothetical protein UHP27_02860 [Muribaculaceae bacterium]|nr:hypothetical protein [Muribaculaceae bacterium]
MDSRFDIIPQTADAEIEVSLIDIAEDAAQSLLNRRAIRRYRGSRVSVNLHARLMPETPSDRLGISVTVDYRNEDDLFRTLLLSYTVTARFRIAHLSSAVTFDGSSLAIPHHLLTLMLGTTVGALRGMLVLRTAGTPLADYPLPLLNVADLAASLSTSARQPA